MEYNKLKRAILSAVVGIAVTAGAQPAKISVDAAHPGHPISPMLWGIFFSRISIFPRTAAFIPSWCAIARLKMAPARNSGI